VSPDHRYWYFLRDSESLFIPQARRQQLTALLVAAIPCYFLSWWLALPLLRLRRTMHRFGKGDLESRANARRRDDFGDLGRTFNAMAEQIQTLLGTERRLLREVSHELRSPLTRLQVAVEIARSRQSDQYLEQIYDEAKRLENLIDELLDLARAENSAGENQRELVQLDLLTQRILNFCDIEAQARGCVLELSSVEGATVSGARELLRRAIENVVRNAIRFAPPQSTVEARVDIHNETVRITVRDLGPGVADEALIRLFDPFYREPSGREKEAGLGLGLAIAKRAVELHGGRIEAFNARPGLRVQISLPVVQGTESKVHAPMLSAS
jgi:two-component system sensor histidine kinase CpxA